MFVQKSPNFFYNQQQQQQQQSPLFFGASNSTTSSNHSTPPSLKQGFQPPSNSSSPTYQLKPHPRQVQQEQQEQIQQLQQQKLQQQQKQQQQQQRHSQSFQAYQPPPTPPQQYYSNSLKSSSGSNSSKSSSRSNVSSSSLADNSYRVNNNSNSSSRGNSRPVSQTYQQKQINQYFNQQQRSQSQIQLPVHQQQPKRFQRYSNQFEFVYDSDHQDYQQPQYSYYQPRQQKQHQSSLKLTQTLSPPQQQQQQTFKQQSSLKQTQYLSPPQQQYRQEEEEEEYYQQEEEEEFEQEFEEEEEEEDFEQEDFEIVQSNQYRQNQQDFEQEEEFEEQEEYQQDQEFEEEEEREYYDDDEEDREYYDEDEDMEPTIVEVIAPKINHKEVSLINTQAEDGSVHKYSEEEKVAYSKFISERLSDKIVELKNYIPIDPTSDQLFTNCNDGVLLNKLMESLFPSQVELKGLVIKIKMNPFEKVQNQNIVIKNATKVGCIIVNIGAEDLVNATPYLVLGIIWQIIKSGLLSQVNQNANEILEILFDEEEQTDHTDGENDQKVELHAKEEHSAEQILIRWVNYHLEKAGIERRISNFSEDIQDSIVYSHLFSQLVPTDFQDLVQRAQNEPNLFVRAELITSACEKIGVKCFLTPSDIALGHPKLNLALVASLFNSEAAITNLRKEREDKQRSEQERAEKERLERERLEREKDEAERVERERMERERLDREHEEMLRVEREIAERERVERERIEREHEEAERAEHERLERERLEREHEEAERAERERIDRERLERELAEREMAERERLENQKEYRIATRIQKIVVDNPDMTPTENVKLVGDIQELKRNIVGELRNTRHLQSELSKITKSIDRVLENKNEGKKLKKSSSIKKKIKPVKGAPNGLNPTKMKNYQCLFYYLQNQPQVFGKLMYLMVPSQLSKTFNNLILSIFPYEISPREEDLFLRAISMALEYQMNDVATLTEFMTLDSVPNKLLNDYFKKKGLKYLQEVVRPMVLQVLDNKDLNLNIDPVWIHKQIQNEKAIKEGKKSEKNSLTPQQCLENAQVKELYESRLASLLDIGNDFVNRIARSIDHIPVQLRFLTRVIIEKSEAGGVRRGAEDPKSYVPYFLIVYRYIVSVIASPDLLHELVLLQHPLISRDQRTNLSMIARLLQATFTNKMWEQPVASTKLAAWIEQHHIVANKFVTSLPQVGELDDLIHYRDYNEVMTENAIGFSTVINLSEVIWLHDTLLDSYFGLEDVGRIPGYEFQKSLNSAHNNNRLSMQVGSSPFGHGDRRRYQAHTNHNNSGPNKGWWMSWCLDLLEAPLELPEQGDRSIQLTFINRIENPDDGLYAPDLFREAKLWMIEILAKIPPPKKDINSIQILRDAIQFCKTSNHNHENMAIIAKCDQLIERIKSFRAEQVSSQPEVYDLFLLECEKEVETVLRKNRLMRTELNRLHALLKQIRIDAAPLSKLVQLQSEQLSKAIAKKELKNVVKKLKDTKLDNNKPVKFAFSDLVKKGMIVNSELPETSFSKTTVVIKPIGGGVYEIEAKIGPISKTVTLELDSLLEFSKNHVDEYPLEGITLDVNLTIHTLMKTFNL
ncbi:calponin domain-containing protein [Cavenderia fasciculata]|uniref:Calponin domain-containing protein n=1 Tax=Cavenderia fasciculata TaxID=261658 RepID=F4PVA5_CACFS|nr:calponin domain-containing protein [Cavenderia fasciculata]EGG19919.1 calponin domain-containing protein [Cavenderia fasciculata]|eukprot:XP_004366902.1 calponin domain-containing protein [Cavenderia fasciculata]